MLMVIIDSTDGKFLGRVFDSQDNPIVLDDDTVFYYEKQILLPDGVRYASSNYIIDTRRSVGDGEDNQ